MGEENRRMEYVSRSVEETYRIAEVLAKSLSGGEVVLLDGDLGAGKTTFVKGLAKALGVEDVVTSPTFTLMNEYKGDKLWLYHFDLYRLDEESAAEMGFEEYFHRPDAVCCIEWNKNECFWGKVIRVCARYAEGEENGRVYVIE